MTMQTDPTVLPYWSIALSVVALLLGLIAVWLNRTGSPPAGPSPYDDLERRFAEIREAHAQALKGRDVAEMCARNAEARASGLERELARVEQIARRPWYWHAWADGRALTERMARRYVERHR
jgi:hypothetical protein